MKVKGGASARTRLTKGQLLEEGKEYGQIFPNSGGHENIVMGSEASAEGKEYGQTLPTAEVIMKNENNTWSLGKNKAHKKAAAGGRQ